MEIKLLYIDLFCGAGGTSTGVESAMINEGKCAKVICCVNHDKNAIASHSENHPDTLHFTEDIRTLNLSKLEEFLKKCKLEYPNAKVVLWASLECTNFSKAKGGQARDADSRTLAEHLFRYIHAIDPDFVQIENVKEFMSWGDIDENGKPISMEKGKSYLKWVSNICKNGYKYDFRILNSADYGAYTSRERYFGIFAKTGLPIIFPEPTHKKKLQLDLFKQFEKWKPVKDVLDLEDEGRSIFDRKKPLVEKTLERIYAGLIKFVAGGKKQFLIKYNSMNKNGKYIAPGIDTPSPVVTCQNRLGIVNTVFITKPFNSHPESNIVAITDPICAIKTIQSQSIICCNYLSSYYNYGSNVSIDEPALTLTTKDRLSIVNPQFIVNQYKRGGNGSDLTNPAPTILANPKQNLVTCWLMNTSFNNVGSSIDEPSQVITANRKHHYLMNPQFGSEGGSVNDPCFTLIARMDKKPPYLLSMENGDIGIVVYEDDSPAMRKIKEFMVLYGICDIKMRMLKIQELKEIMGFPKNYVLIGTQTEQKKYIGNAVEVTMAKRLCEALAKVI